MQAYIASLKVGGRTKNNVRRHLKNLCHFAQRRGYLPKGLTEADDLTRVKETPKPIAIYTPAEMARLLAHAPEDTLPFLAIGAFAGLRHAEILRLDWSEVDRAGGLIVVKATKAKTASRRLVPVDQMSERLTGLAKRPGVDLIWKRNALRHSFISYRVAQVQSVAQVALEAGNSPQISFSNYRELVKPADAVKRFAIVPETPANVVALPHAAAA
jgi:integrase